MVVEARFAERVTTVEELRELVGWPTERAQLKELTALDQHCRDFIANAPFALLATASADGRSTVSPKGDGPGFVRVLDDQTLVIPDRPGNRRLDGLRNILENPYVGLIFMIPNVGQTLRVNGRASIVRDADLLASLEARGRVPQLAIVVEVEQAFLHCPKALLRSNLWERSRQSDQSPVASFACMLVDHVNLPGLTPADVEASLAEAVAAGL